MTYDLLPLGVAADRHALDAAAALIIEQLRQLTALETMTAAQTELAQACSVALDLLSSMQNALNDQR